MKSGIELMADERQRHFDEEGWTAEHDDLHVKNQLIYAAVSYIMAGDGTLVQAYWPFARSWWKPEEDGVRNLVKAGALLAAEIDRLQRAKEAR